MIPRLARDTQPAAPPRSTDLVDGWLSVFVGLLKVPEKQAAGITEEIESHLRERVRDLLLSGVSEGDATRKAISELGEAADVAARYRALRTEPRRRLIMHASLFTAAGAALALSIAAISGGKPQPSPQSSHEAAPPREQELLARIHAEQAHNAVVQKFLASALASADPNPVGSLSLAQLLDQAAAKANDMPASAREPLLLALTRARTSAARADGAAEFVAPDQPELDEARFDVDFDRTAAGEVFASLGELLKSPVMVQWTLIEAGGFSAKNPITLRARKVTAPAVIRAINQSAGLKGSQSLECRMTAGTLEIAPREFFDQREKTLVTYDLSGIISARHETYGEEREKVVEEVAKLISNFVSADDWRENGGELAQMSVVGDRLFVEAPARMHPQIKWILDQLPSDKQRSDSGQRGNVPVLSDLPVLGNPRNHNAANAESELRVYPLKHVAAGEALDTLRKMERIKRIDFTSFASDSRTNSILARASADDLTLFEGALKQLDRPAAKP